MQILKEEILTLEAIKKYDDIIYQKNLEIYLEGQLNIIIRNVILFPNKLQYVYNFTKSVYLTNGCLKDRKLNYEEIKNLIVQKV
jgi:hypothetical protein